jgi:hypothetical protein
MLASIGSANGWDGLTGVGLKRNLKNVSAVRILVVLHLLHLTGENAELFGKFMVVFSH